MKTISVINQKGGVGKTSMTANLSSELAYKGFRVVMLDLDRQTDLTDIFLPNGNKGPNIVDLLQKKCTVGEATVTLSENLSIIPGSKFISKFHFKGSEGALLPITKYFASNAVDFAVLDHPPAFNNSSVAGFVASNHILIVSEAEALAIKNLKQLMDDLAEIKKKHQAPLDILGIALNKIDNRRCLTKTMLGKCRSVFGKAVFNTAIGNDTSIPTALNQNIPVRKLHWRSRTVTQFSQLADEMLQRMAVKK